MFVSGVLKKCVNLLSHDFLKTHLKSDANNEDTSAVCLDTTQVIERDTNNDLKNLQDVPVVHNGGCDVVTADESVSLSQEHGDFIPFTNKDCVICSLNNKLDIVPSKEEEPEDVEVLDDSNIVHVDHFIDSNTNDETLYEHDSTFVQGEQTFIANQSRQEKKLSHSSESSNETGDNTSYQLNCELSTQSVNAVCFNDEPFLTDNIECSKIINVEYNINETITEATQNQDIVGDEQNLEAIDDTNFTNGVDVDVDCSIDNSNLKVECEIPESVDQIQDNLGKPQEFNHTSNSDIVITKEVIESAIISNKSGNSMTMSELGDRTMHFEEEIAELKLQLNATQQVRASLELQLTQKEEIIIKSQTESLRKQQSYKQEIKQLKEKLDEKNSEDENTTLKELQEANKSLKLREGKLLSEVNARKNDEQNYRKIMDEFEKTIGTQVSELQKLNEEHSLVKRHLATLEMAFSDVLQKYDRSKNIIEGFKSNEEALRQSLNILEDNVMKSEQKYESLKAHAKAQIEKCNQEILLMRDQYDSEIHKLTAIVKRLEIKNASLTDSLDQKNKECSALAALCDEVTGKV